MQIACGVNLLRLVLMNCVIGRVCEVGDGGVVSDMGIGLEGGMGVA